MKPTLIAYTLPSRSLPTRRPKLVKEYAIANAFLPTLKTNFFGNVSTSIERFKDYNKLIMNTI
jgi:hypothetical protein